MGVGRIYSQGSNSVALHVQSLKEVAKIIEHFEKYPLITTKQANYELFKQAYNLVLNNEHLKLHYIYIMKAAELEEGLPKLVGIKTSMNSGLSPELKKAFPKITRASAHPAAATAAAAGPPVKRALRSAKRVLGCFAADIENKTKIIDPN